MLGLLTLCLCLTAHAQPNPTLDLGGRWRFSIDEAHLSDDAWHQPGYDASRWGTMAVPGSWDTENDTAHFVGNAFYLTHFDLPSDWTSPHAHLYFGAVYQTAQVWLNGQYLGEHVGGYTPFEFDVTAMLDRSGPNTLAVAVNNRYSRGAWWKWGGIHQPVRLLGSEAVRIVRQQVTAEPDLESATATVRTTVFVENLTGASQPIEIASQVLSQDHSTSFGPTARGTLTLPPHASDDVTLEIPLRADETTLWDIDQPYLYRAVTTLATDERALDESDDRFGIRKIEAVDARLLLNGRPLRLNGLNRIATHRAYGQAEPSELIRFDIHAMKAMGANLTRIGHHPQHPALLDTCDEVGMLLIGEVPVWGKTDPQVIPDNPRTKAWLTEMIQRDYNHPSIIAWSVGNELAERHLSGQRMSWKVYEYVRTMLEHVAELDPHRLKTYVSNTATEANGPGVDPNDLVDLLCHNSYGGSGDQVKKLHQVWPNKPVFVTELGKSQLGEGLDATLDPQLVDEIRALREFDFVVGCSIWSYNDYRSRFANTPPSENRAWGVYNVWRQPKAAAYELRELFTQQADGTPLPTMSRLPDDTSPSPIAIQAVVPMGRACMVGFTVTDAEASYELRIDTDGQPTRTMRVDGLQGAVKVSDLAPGHYTVQIRIAGDEAPHAWSSPCAVTIE